MSKTPRGAMAVLISLSGLKGVLRIVGWLGAAGFLASYFGLPLPTHVGTMFGDPPYHFSWANYSLDLLAWAVLLYILYRLWQPGLRDILLGVGWFIATSFMVLYTDFPFLVHMGIDWGRHFSPANHALDFLGWGVFLYLLYAFCRPVFRVGRLKLITTLAVLTLALTTLTLPFQSPFRRTWSSGGHISLRSYEVPHHGAQAVIITNRGLPYDFYYHSTGYDGAGEVLWDFVALKKDTLLFNLLFWLAMSLVVARIVYHKSMNEDLKPSVSHDC